MHFIFCWTNILVNDLFGGQRFLHVNGVHSIFHVWSHKETYISRTCFLLKSLECSREHKTQPLVIFFPFGKRASIAAHSTVSSLFGSWIPMSLYQSVEYQTWWPRSIWKFLFSTENYRGGLLAEIYSSRTCLTITSNLILHYATQCTWANLPTSETVL